MKIVRNKKLFWNIETIKFVKIDFSPTLEKKYKQSAEIKGNQITFLGESSVVNQQTFVFVVNKTVGTNPIHSIYPFLKNCHEEYVLNKLDVDSQKLPIPAIFQVTLCVVLTNELGHTFIKEVTGYFKYNVFYKAQGFPYGDFVEFCVSLVNNNLNSELTKLNIKNRYARIDISFSGWSPTFLITRSKSSKYSMKRTKSYSLPMLSWSSRARVIRMLAGFKPTFVFKDSQDVIHYYYEPKMQIEEDKDKIKQEIYEEFLKVLKGIQSDIYTPEDIYIALLEFFKNFPNFLSSENITNITSLVAQNIFYSKEKNNFESGISFLYNLKQFLISSRETPLSRIVETVFQKDAVDYIQKFESLLNISVDNIKRGKTNLIEHYFDKDAVETNKLKLYNPQPVLLGKETKKQTSEIQLEAVIISRD